MAHTTANDTTTVMALAYHPPSSSLPSVKQDALLRRAEEAVKAIAPPPGPVTNAYKQLASDAELLAFEFFVEFPGYVKSESVGPLSTTYAEFKELNQMIARVMGSFVASGYPGRLRSVPMARG